LNFKYKQISDICSDGKIKKDEKTHIRRGGLPNFQFWLTKPTIRQRRTRLYKKRRNERAFYFHLYFKL